MSAGRKSARITPFDGDAFFTSAMMPDEPAAIFARRLASKPRRPARSSASPSTSARRLARSRCFFCGGDFVCFDREDFVQDIGHEWT